MGGPSKCRVPSWPSLHVWIVCFGASFWVCVYSSAPVENAMLSTSRHCARYPGERNIDFVENPSLVPVFHATHIQLSLLELHPGPKPLPGPPTATMGGLAEYLWNCLGGFNCHTKMRGKKWSKIRQHVVFMWFMCGLCGVYVWFMCGLCVVYVWFMRGLCVVYKVQNAVYKHNQPATAIASRQQPSTLIMNHKYYQPVLGYPPPETVQESISLFLVAGAPDSYQPSQLRGRKWLDNTSTPNVNQPSTKPVLCHDPNVQNQYQNHCQPVLLIIYQPLTTSIKHHWPSSNVHYTHYSHNSWPLLGIIINHD